MQSHYISLTLKMLSLKLCVFQVRIKVGPRMTMYLFSEYFFIESIELSEVNEILGDILNLFLH